MAMIIAIEGLVPDRRLSKAAALSTPAPFTQTSNPAAAWPHQQQQPAVTTASAQPAATQSGITPPTAPAPQPSPASSINPFIYPEKQNRVPPIVGAFDVAFDLGEFRNLPFLPKAALPAHRP